MNSSKLISILKILSAKELNAFEKLVASPFFNVNEEVTDLFSLLKTLYPQLEEKLVEKKVIFKKLYLGKRFNEQKLRYVMTDLTRLLEEF